MGWERAAVGHEHELRRYAQHWRALPWCEPQRERGWRVSDERVWVARFGEKVAVLNTSVDEVQVRVEWRDGGPEHRLRLRPFEVLVRSASRRG